MSEISQRGLRDIATLRTRSCQAGPLSGAQATSRFVLLENEKARLNRELDNWNGRKNSAEKKLANIEDELTVIKKILLGDSQVRPMRNTTRPRLKEDSYVAPESQTGVLFEY